MKVGVDELQHLGTSKENGASEARRDATPEEFGSTLNVVGVPMRNQEEFYCFRGIYFKLLEILEGGGALSFRV